MRKSAECSVDTLMRRSPAVIRVFLDHKFLCPGCPFAPLHSLDYACRAHQADAAAVLAAVDKALQSAPQAALSPKARPRPARKAHADP